MQHLPRLCPGLFVTGTDTGVGKSAVVGALVGALRRGGLDAGFMKPVQTGVLQTSTGQIAPDVRFLSVAAGIDDPMDLVCPIRLEAPLAPATAAELEGREIHVATILEAYRDLAARHDWLIVEGAGGIAVPITRTYLMRDLARDMGLPILIVARPALGTINHTVLTVHFARAGGLEIAGVVINNYPAAPGLAERTAPTVIERLAQVPILGYLPHTATVDVDAAEPGDIVSMLEQTPILSNLLNRLQMMNPV